jgi:hypothetical protein
MKRPSARFLRSIIVIAGTISSSTAAFAANPCGINCTNVAVLPDVDAFFNCLLIVSLDPEEIAVHWLGCYMQYVGALKNAIHTCMCSDGFTCTDEVCVQDPCGTRCDDGRCLGACSSPQVPDKLACACVCPPGSTPCASGGGRLCFNNPPCQGGTIDVQSCTCSCPSVTTLCGGECVDTSSDATNCGVCGNACPAGSTCASGACKQQGPGPCSPGAFLCSNPDGHNSTCCSLDQTCSPKGDQGLFACCLPSPGCR